MGYMIDGTHAEYVRTPFADTSLYHLPEGLNQDVAVFLSDILPTSHEIGVQYGDVKPGDNVGDCRSRANRHELSAHCTVLFTCQYYYGGYG